MKPFLKQIDENGERWLLLFFYTTIVITIAMEVLRRFVFSYSSIWGEEVARYAFIYLAWVGASAAVKERAHIRIDVLLHYLPNRGKAAIYLFGDICTLIVALFASTGRFTLSTSHSSLALSPTVWVSARPGFSLRFPSDFH